jgi:hypothetical protein
MGRGRRADPARRIGRWRRKRATGLQQRLHHRMRRDPDCDCRQARRDRARDVRVRHQRQDKRQRAGPEGIGQRFGLRRQVGDASGGLDIGHMHDQRVEPGPPLCGEDARHGGLACRVGGKAVDRLRRNGHEAAIRRRSRRVRDPTPSGGRIRGLGSGIVT